MSGYLDPLTFPTMPLPAVWSPAQDEELTPEERLGQADLKVEASLLRLADPIEAVLRILFHNLATRRVDEPPEGYNPDLQGQWDPDRPVFAFTRGARLLHEERDRQTLLLDYELEGNGFFRVEITEERVTIERTGG